MFFLVPILLLFSLVLADALYQHRCKYVQLKDKLATYKFVGGEPWLGRRFFKNDEDYQVRQDANRRARHWAHLGDVV